MTMAHGTVSPLLTIATPVTTPQATTPGVAGTATRTPRASSRRHCGSRKEVRPGKLGLRHRHGVARGRGDLRYDLLRDVAAAAVDLRLHLLVRETLDTDDLHARSSPRTHGEANSGSGAIKFVAGVDRTRGRTSPVAT